MSEFGAGYKAGWHAAIEAAIEAYREFLVSDDLDAFRDALTRLEEEVAGEDADGDPA